MCFQGEIKVMDHEKPHWEHTELEGNKASWWSFLKLQKRLDFILNTLCLPNIYACRWVNLDGLLLIMVRKKSLFTKFFCHKKLVVTVFSILHPSYLTRKVQRSYQNKYQGLSKIIFSKSKSLELNIYIYIYDFVNNSYYIKMLVKTFIISWLRRISFFRLWTPRVS